MGFLPIGDLNMFPANTVQFAKSKDSVDLTDLELAEPFLSFIRFLLAKCKINKFLVPFLSRCKGDHVLLHVAEIIPGVGVATCSKTLCMAVKQEVKGRVKDTITLKYLLSHLCAFGVSSSHCSYSGMVKKSR